MFEEFFGLTTKPFGKTPDPGFLYESAAARRGAGAAGVRGRGEGAVAARRRDRIGEDDAVARAHRPHRRRAAGDPADQSAPHADAASPLDRLGARTRSRRASATSCSIRFTRNSSSCTKPDREPVLIIDEAQLIPTKSTFDEIRLLTNFQLDDQNLLSVLLIGQPELETRLDRAHYAPLRQRIGMRYRLGPLSLEETDALHRASHPRRRRRAQSVHRAMPSAPCTPSAAASRACSTRSPRPRCSMPSATTPRRSTRRASPPPRASIACAKRRER